MKTDYFFDEFFEIFNEFKRKFILKNESVFVRKKSQRNPSIFENGNLFESVESVAKIKIPAKFLALGGWGILPENLAKIFPAGTKILPPTRENADKILAEIAAGTANFAFGYSLGAWLLLEAATRVPADFSCKNVALFAPFLAFPREAEKGGKIARTQVKFLRRWLAKNPVPALADFYQRAQILSFPPPNESQISSMLERDFGLEMLCGNGLVRVPAAAQNWPIFLGENDSLLDVPAVAATFPQNPVKIIPAGTHDLATIFRADFDGGLDADFVAREGPSPEGKSQKAICPSRATKK